MAIRARNRLHSLLQRRNLKLSEGKTFSQKHRDWWHKLDLSLAQIMHISHDLVTIDHVEAQLTEIKQEITRLSTAESWAEHAP